MSPPTAMTAHRVVCPLVALLALLSSAPHAQRGAREASHSVWPGAESCELPPSLRARWPSLPLQDGGRRRNTGLTIVRNFIGGEPGPLDVGTGNLLDIFDEAADRWERAIHHHHVLVLHFGWAPMLSAGHLLKDQGGRPNRETEGLILFNNNDYPGNMHFYLDPTPETDEEYRGYTEEVRDLGGTPVNVARLFHDPVGAAASPAHVDLLTVAMHEIGHALGLSVDNRSFIAESGDADVDVDGVRPYQGTTIPLVRTPWLIVGHIDFVAYGTLMSGAGPRERRNPSGIDLLANLQLSRFSRRGAALPVPPATPR